MTNNDTASNLGEDLDPNTEGPYWDYTAIATWAGRQRDIWARIVADYVVQGDFATAQDRAAKYAAAEARCDRISERYDATKDADYAWIGWSHRHDGWAGLNAMGVRGSLA